MQPMVHNQFRLPPYQICWISGWLLLPSSAVSAAIKAAEVISVVFLHTAPLNGSQSIFPSGKYLEVYSQFEKEGWNVLLLGLVQSHPYSIFYITFKNEKNILHWKRYFSFGTCQMICFKNFNVFSNIFQVEILIKSGPFLWRICFTKCQRSDDKMSGS